MARLFSGLLFTGSLIYAGVTDLRSRTIPYLSCILLAAAGLMNFSPAHLFGLILALPFFLAAGFGKGGAGDTLLVAAASLTLGFRAGLIGMALALTLFLIFAAIDRLLRKAQRKELPKSYPLAPFFAVGFIAAFFMI